MAILNSKFQISTQGFNDIIDITRKVGDIVNSYNVKNAMVHIFVKGSTASITTLEYESGLVSDLKEAFEKLAPINARYEHNEKWHDGNGYAHIRASIVGNSITIPYADGSLELGTWQQIVLVDFDNKNRTREVVVQVIT